jgi:hypothetical protein
VEKVHLNPAYGRGSHGGGSKAKRPPLPPGGGGPGGGATPGRGPGGGTRISPAAAAVKHAAAHHAAGEQVGGCRCAKPAQLQALILENSTISWATVITPPPFQIPKIPKQQPGRCQ